jgi:beta-mannosidase
VLPHPPQLDGTDSHLYLGWRGGDERQLPGLARALPRLVRFVSEFGAQAVPSGAGAGFCEPARWPDLDWDGLAERHGLEKARFDRYVPPADHATFDGWRDATQRYQAELIRRHVEALRRLKYRPTGGFALAVLADPAPAVSLAVLDHERRPKAGYEALRLACLSVVVVADRLPAAVVPGDALALDVHVVSDRREPVEGARVSARLSWPGGEHRWRWAGDVEADACVRVGTLQAVAPDVGPLALDLRLRLPGGEDVTNRYEAAVAGTAEGAVEGAAGP